MKTFAFLVTALLLFGTSSTALWGQCAQCFNDHDITTNCIETKLEVAFQQTNSVCYRLIVYNHQYSPSSNARCTTYNTERYLTMELVNPACYDSVNLQINPIKLNTWVYNLSGTLYNSYNYTTGHPTKVTWQRDPIRPAPNFARCEIDTFMICLLCTTKSIDSTCANGGFDMKVYFSDSNGNPTCVDETGPPRGRNYDKVTIRPPVCNMQACGTCQFYGSSCNSWDVKFGCDYVEVTVKNDHSYPQCGPTRRIEFWIGGVATCSKANKPKFRDWVTTQSKDTLDRIYFAFTSLNQGINPCDSFKIKIPFCCTEEDSTMYIQLGEGFCSYWGSGSADGSSPPRIYHTFPALDCPDCYLDKDEGRLGRAAVPGWCRAAVPGWCDTLEICNKNTSNTQCGGSKGTGNTKIDRVVIDVGTTCAGVIVLPPHSTTGWTANPQAPPSTVWIAEGPKIDPCDCIKFLLCGCTNLGVVKWITMDKLSGDTITVDSTGGWDEEPWPGPWPKQGTPELPTFSSVGTAQSSVVATVGEPVPNPTTGLTTIPLMLVSGSGPALVSIYGADGNLMGVQQQNLRIGLNDLRVDGSDWPSGSYRVRIQIGETVMSSTFILRR
ncbi:MAG: T9SS C-terminal target domain-containing protein [Chlorobi bacterium CHB2]|nr:T9SS C-terminal target domain-containing protein [Chlorobi bacterium CHB2]